MESTPWLEVKAMGKMGKMKARKSKPEKEEGSVRGRTGLSVIKKADG
jgi:hypothetical protein